MDDFSGSQDAATTTTIEGPDVDELRRMYREWWNATEEARRLSLRDAHYYHGYRQLSDTIRAELAKRRQPATYWNKIRPAIQGVLGLLDGNETDPEAIGRNDDDDDAAEIVTQILRYIADESDFQGVKRDASFDYLVFGTLAAITEVDGTTGDPRTSYIPNREFFHDPYSLRHDFLDAKYLGRAKWVDVDVANRMFPKAAARLGSLASSTFAGDGAECQPELRGIWVDAGRRRVRIIELYHVDEHSGAWRQSIYCHAGLLHHGPSPYQNDEQQSACPITAVSFEIDDDGLRYGMIRDMIPIQDSINNNKSKQTHILNTAQVEATGDVANPVDRETARKEAARPDGVMPLGWKRVPMSDVFEGINVQLSADMSAIERMAPSPSLLGRSGGANQSGRQSQILQQAGYTELARAFSRFERWEERTYEQMWFRAVQYMDDQRTIRVTDDTGARQKLTINQPVREMRPQHVLDPATGLSMPTLVPVHVATNNHLAKMDMDITLKTVPQADTLRGEAVQHMLEWSAKTGVSVLSPDFELVIEMSDIPAKAMVLDKYRKLRAASEQQQAAQQQAQQAQAQQAQQIAQAATASKIQRDQAQAERDKSLAGKHSVEASSEALDLQVKEAMIAHLSALPLSATPSLDTRVQRPLA